MKWTAKLAVVAALAASAGVVCAWGQEAAVAKSVNAVGVVKYKVPANGVFACFSLPLTPMGDPRGDGSWVWSETSLSQQLETGSAVYFWTNSTWMPYIKQATNQVYTNGWARKANTWVLKRGEAFFVRGVTTAEEVQTISLLGELPTDEEMEYDLTGSQNFDTRSAAVYPVDVTFGSTDLADQLGIGDTVYFWTNSTWMPYVKQATNQVYTNGWARKANTWALNVGEGIFIKRVGDGMTITNSRPFEWDE